MVSDTSITATLTITAGATLGNGHTIAVAVPGGNTGTLPFTVQVNGALIAFSGPSPALTTITANTTTKVGLVTVSNSAFATGSVTLSAAPTVVKVGTAGGTFSVIAGGSCASGSVIAPGGNCTINCAIRSWNLNGNGYRARSDHGKRAYHEPAERAKL